MNSMYISKFGNIGYEGFRSWLHKRKHIMLDCIDIKKNFISKYAKLVLRALGHGWLNEMEFRVLEHIFKLYLKDQLKN
jgi:hypothetical protein